MCEQGQSYLYDMLYAFKLYTSEINSNGRLKWEHLEFSFLAFKNIYLYYLNVYD